MKKVLKIALIGILAVLTLLSSFACAPTGGGTTKDGLLYKKDKEGVYVVYGYRDDGTKKDTITIDISTEAENIRIDKGAFSGNNTLKTVIVSSDVKEITAGAFENMLVLETLEVPFIGKIAASDSYYKETGSALKDEKAIDAERTIAHFFGSTEYDKGAQVDVKYLKEGAETTVTCYMPVTLNKIIVNAPTTYGIPMDAFNGAVNITEVELKGAVNAIGERAFKGTSLTTATIPATVKNIYASAFENCVVLSTVAISKDASDIVVKEKAFKGCVKMNYIGQNDVINVTIDFAAFSEIAEKAFDFGRTFTGDDGYYTNNALGFDIDAIFGETTICQA